jgi:DNA-binding NarL/FixJ family response regulator
MKHSTVLIADDHSVVIEGLRRILDHPEFEVIGVAKDGRALVQAAAQLQPDVIITDIAMPLLNGIDAVREIHRQNQKPKVVFLTMHSEVSYATAALAAGACGYVLKCAAGEELIDAIRNALNDRTYISKAIAKSVRHAREIRPIVGGRTDDSLTLRQREVLQLLAEGLQVKEIAAVLNLSPKTVEFHKYRTMDLLAIRTVAALTRYAMKQGIVA